MVTNEKAASGELREFWTARHLCTLATLRKDGSPHVVPVGVTVDEDFAVARIITRRGSAKVAHVRRGGDAGATVAVSQFDGGRWSTLEGHAVVVEDAESVRDAENRYAARYQRQPVPNPERVVIVITLTRRLGME